MMRIINSHDAHMNLEIRMSLAIWVFKSDRFILLKVYRVIS